MRRALLMVSIGLVAACGGAGPGIPPGTVSCQPYGYTPAPIPFPIQVGPVTSDVAEQRSAAMIRTCMRGAGAITGVTISSKPATGQSPGPNAGQPVWWVTVDVAVEGVLYQSHFVIEVNQATGVPLMIAYG